MYLLLFYLLLVLINIIYLLLHLRKITLYSTVIKSYMVCSFVTSIGALHIGGKCLGFSSYILEWSIFQDARHGTHRVR